jgi:hypothetical protein
VLTAYGGCRCVCCGETGLEFLTLEHPNRDGGTHRKLLGSSASFYKALRDQGFPKEPQMVVNCFNCNLAKGFHGTCPHQMVGSL